MKILELFNNSVKKLNKINIKNSKLDVKILLSNILNVKSSDLFLYLNNEISENNLNNFNILLKRRLKKEPIANIINKKDFWDYEFYVDKNVLTPRPDSETLIEAVIDNYKNKNKKLKFLDLGTGSGCLILTLLKIYKNSFGIGIDINKKSLSIAKKNAKLLNIKNIKFKKNNWNDNIKEKFDIVISNPPYIPTKIIEKLEPEVNKYNPIISLDGGVDGLNCYKYISNNIKKNMNENSKLFLEIGKNQKNKIIQIFKKNNFKFIKSYKDISNIDRVLIFKINK